MIFDVDGTLLDSDEAIIQAFQHSFHKNHFPLPQRAIIMKFAGYSAPTWVTAVIKAMHLRSTKQNTSKITSDLINALSGGFFVAYGRQMPGALQALSSLHSLGIKLGVTSNSPKKHALIRLEAFGLAHYLEQILTVEDIKKEKPAPASLKKILFKLRTPLNNALYVGDSAIDVKYARNAGLAIALLSNPRNKKLAADYTLFSLLELTGIVRQSHAHCKKIS